MIAEGRALAELHEHVVVKVPFCKEGLEATHALTSDGIPVNMTLVFSPNQALLAAGAGATYVSCFMGRLDDISVDSGGVVPRSWTASAPAASPRRSSPRRSAIPST